MCFDVFFFPFPPWIQLKWARVKLLFHHRMSRFIPMHLRDTLALMGRKHRRSLRCGSLLGTWLMKGSRIIAALA